MDNGRKKNILLGVLIVGVISITIAFAALSTNLRLNGSANVAATRWNIHFDHWALDTQSTITVGGNTQHNTAEYPQVSGLTMADNSNVTKVSGINVTLHQPNDYVKYTFDIVNDGTIDGELSNFDRNITCSGNNCEEVVEYTVACEDSSDNDALASNYVLQAGSTVNCYLQIKYKDVDNVAKEASNKVQANVAGTNQRYEQSALTISVAPTWTWIQSTQANNNQSGNGGNTPSNPYETTFNGDYIYQCFDGINPLYEYDFEDATDSYGDNECPDGYEYYGDEYNYHTCYLKNETGWYTTLNPESDVYLRKDGTKEEICRVFGSGQAGTVCLIRSRDNSNYSSEGSYYADFEDVTQRYENITTTADLQATGLKGYSLAKAEEMLTKGASFCEVNGIDTYKYFSCQKTSGGSCYLRNDDVIYCYSDDDYRFILSN